LKQLSRRRAAVLQSKLDDFTNKKSKEAKYWLQAYRKICGKNPNIKGAELLTSMVKKETKIVGAANKKEEDEWKKQENNDQNMADVVEQAMKEKLHKQNKILNNDDEVEEVATGLPTSNEVVVGVGSVPQKYQKKLKLNNFYHLFNFF